MPTVKLQSIHVHPLKSGRGFAPLQAGVEPWGLAGDRRWLLVDAGKRVMTQREHVRLALAEPESPADGIRVSAPAVRSSRLPCPGRVRR